MNPVELNKVIADLKQQREAFRNQYHQTVGALALAEKLLATFPVTKEAEHE